MLPSRSAGAPSSSEALELHRLSPERLRRLANLALELAEASQDWRGLIETIEHRFAELATAVCELSLPGISEPQLEPSTANDRGTIGLPILFRDQRIAQLKLSRSAERPYDDNEIAFLRVAAAYAGNALGNARALASERDARADAERTATTLRNTEAAFSALSNSGVVGVLLADLNGHVVEINQALADLVGYPREEFLSGRLTWTKLTPLEHTEVDARALSRLRSSGTGGLREKSYLHRDGSRIPVLVGTAMLAADSPLAVSFVVDLRERRKVEAEVERMREVVEAQAKVAAIVMASDDAIIGCTVDGVVTSWNPGAQRIFGYTAPEVVGRSLDRIVPPEHRAEAAQRLRDVAAGGVQRFETLRQHQDGRLLAAAISMAPVHDASGRVTGISKISRDVSQQRHAQAQLARAKEATERANAELEAFSYSVAHDLRAPLRGMNGFAQLLLDHYGLQFDEQGRDWLGEVLENSKKMGALIDALLSLARVSRRETRCEQVALSQLARGVADGLSARAPERHIDWQIAPELTASLDPILARALLENLLSNAFKFTARVEHAIIEFGSEAAAGGHTFFVRDNGAGFDMAYASRLFGAFQRLHSSAAFPGTGIGLATVQRIVHRHGGRVWAEGVVNCGAMFYVFLPEERPRGAQ